MEKIVDKSAAREQMRENYRTSGHNFSEAEVEKLCDDAESDIQAWAEWGEKQRLAGLEEAARYVEEATSNHAFRHVRAVGRKLIIAFRAQAQPKPSDFTPPRYRVASCYDEIAQEFAKLDEMTSGKTETEEPDDRKN